MLLAVLFFLYKKDGDNNIEYSLLVLVLPLKLYLGLQNFVSGPHCRLKGKGAPGSDVCEHTIFFFDREFVQRRLMCQARRQASRLCVGAVLQCDGRGGAGCFVERELFFFCCEKNIFFFKRGEN